MFQRQRVLIYGKFYFGQYLGWVKNEDPLWIPPIDCRIGLQKDFHIRTYFLFVLKKRIFLPPFYIKGLLPNFISIFNTSFHRKIFLVSFFFV